MAEMAMQIIKKQPYALKDHPRTKGSLCLQDNSEHFEDWEINMVQKFNVSKRWASLLCLFLFYLLLILIFTKLIFYVF